MKIKDSEGRHRQKPRKHPCADGCAMMMTTIPLEDERMRRLIREAVIKRLLKPYWTNCSAEQTQKRKRESFNEHDPT